MKLFAFTCGWLTGPTGHFLDGEHGASRMPVPAVLIRHAQSEVLCSTGRHPDVAHEAAGHLGCPADASAGPKGTRLAVPNATDELPADLRC